MQGKIRTGNIQDIEFNVVYSRRRTIAISILPDSSVIIRVPLRTPDKTVVRIINEKSEWIKKHMNNYIERNSNRPGRLYSDGEIHLFRGRELNLQIEKSVKPYIIFGETAIEIGLSRPEDQKSVKKLLYDGYKREAISIFPVTMDKMLRLYEKQKFQPSGLIIRTMKRRWGSCSNKGMITLSTELIKLSDIYIEYVIVHELCHLRHHNHGANYYELLSEIFPDWKNVRKQLRNYHFL